ncbi:MAG: hypothetical protein AMXMBFR64_44410 [Myxococcales bacterium]
MQNQEFEPQEFGVGDPHAAEVGIEPDHPPTRMLFTQLVVMTIIVVVMVIALVEYVKIDVRAEVERKDLALPSQQLKELRAREKAALTGYELLDAEKGLYQIPVAQAMSRLVAEPQLIVRVPPVGDGGPLFEPPKPPGGPASAPAPRGAH